MGQEKYNSTVCIKLKHNTHAAGTVHLDSRQQPCSSAETATSASPLPIYERGSQHTYIGGGTAWNELEKNDAVSTTTRQELYEELAKTSHTTDHFRYNMETAQ